MQDWIIAIAESITSGQLPDKEDWDRISLQDWTAALQLADGISRAREIAMRRDGTWNDGPCRCEECGCVLPPEDSE